MDHPALGDDDVCPRDVVVLGAHSLMAGLQLLVPYNIWDET